MFYSVISVDLAGDKFIEESVNLMDEAKLQKEKKELKLFSVLMVFYLNQSFKCTIFEKITKKVLLSTVNNVWNRIRKTKSLTNN